VVGRNFIGSALLGCEDRKGCGQVSVIHIIKTILNNTTLSFIASQRESWTASLEGQAGSGWGAREVIACGRYNQSQRSA
jgi:hypothetical protein